MPGGYSAIFLFKEDIGMRSKILAAAIALMALLVLSPPAVWAKVPNPDINLEAPQNLAIELKTAEDGESCFYLSWSNPQSIVDILSEGSKIGYEIDFKFDDANWVYIEEGEPVYSGILIDDSGQSGLSMAPAALGDIGAVDTSSHAYCFRVRYAYQINENWNYSPFSKPASIGTEAFYSEASSWAESELDQAVQYNLIPDILKGADMTKPINREEFAELALLLYEKTSGQTSSVNGYNPFTDTANQQVVRAYTAGITKGTSATTFSPAVLINREQCATMLFRAISAAFPNADYSINGVKDFPDQQNISEWAAQATKYMFKTGIIKGDDNGNFMPKAVASAQQAANYGMATREAAILMAVRAYEKLQ